MKKRYWIYRMNHVAGRQALSVIWAVTAADAVTEFKSTDDLGSTGEFVAEPNSRPVSW